MKTKTNGNSNPAYAKLNKRNGKAPGKNPCSAANRTESIDLDEDYMNYDAPNKPTYTLTTSEDDGETSSSSTVTTSNPDALLDILRNAGMGGGSDKHDHNDGEDEMDIEIDTDSVSGLDSDGGCRGDMGMDGDDMASFIRIMDNPQGDEEMDEAVFDNEPNPTTHDPHDFSKPRNTTKMRHGVTGPGDNKLGEYVEDIEEGLHRAWKMEKLDESLESFFSHGEQDKMHQIADGELDVMDDYDLYEKLFDYYAAEMPYGTAKARTGDPTQWITSKLDTEFNSYDNEEVTKPHAPKIRLPYRDD